jgi:hypothetical protein
MPAQQRRSFGSDLNAVVMPPPEIPVRSTSRFLKALWLLAALVVLGMVYSFWRISSVATPKLDVPTVSPVGSAPR